MNEPELIERLRQLRIQAGDLCSAIEGLPCSERQTALSVKASAASQELQSWVASIEHQARHSRRHPGFICTPEAPMPKGAIGTWQHTRVEEVGDQRTGWPAGDIQRMRCKDCGKEWEEELPQ